MRLEGTLTDRAVAPPASVGLLLGRRWIRGSLLAGVVLLALLLRLWGPPWQLPKALYTDEGKYVLSATRSAQGIDDEPTDFRNPSLFRHLLNLEYRLTGLLRPSGANDGASAERELAETRLLLARLTVALLGAGTVGLLYFVGQRAFGPRSGLIAAGLLAVNFLHVHLSHFSLNDVPAGFFLVAALLPSVGLIKRPGRRGFLLAGLFAGLAAATKYNFGIVLVVPLAACALHAARRTAPRELLVLGLPLLGAGVLAGFLIGMPEIVWSFAEVRDGIVRQADIGDRRWRGQESGPVLMLYGKAVLHAFGLPAVLTAVVGLAVLLRRRSAVGLALAAGPLVYLGYMAGKVLFFARFALPLVPFGCLFAAYGLVRLWSTVRTRGARVLLATVACLAALGPPALLSIRLDGLARLTDTREQARQWILANVRPGTRLAAQTYSLPYALQGDDLEWTYEITFFTLFSDAQRFYELACAGNRYILVSSFRWEREQTASRRGGATGYEALAGRGQAVATFWPGPDESSVPLNVDDVALPFWSLERYARPGPTIRVYELAPEACQ